MKRYDIAYLYEKRDAIYPMMHTDRVSIMATSRPDAVYRLLELADAGRRVVYVESVQEAVTWE